MKDEDATFPIANDSSWARSAEASYAILILFIVTLFSHLDRQLPALVVGPIRAEFGITDTAFSYLQGYAFALIYAVVGIPFGRFVDRRNRRNLIAGGIVVWSAMTIACGLATTYWQFFLARMGLGIGEAVLAPAAYSMIADLVPPERRGRALGIYYVSIAIGAGASMLVGGLILAVIPAGGLALPLLGLLEAHKLIFVFAGLPGFLMAVLMFTLREPVRRDTGSLARSDEKEGSIQEFLAYMARHRASFARVLLYPAVMAVIAYGALAWAPTFYQRKFGVAPADAAQAVGALVAVTGLLGSLSAAFLSDHWLKQGRPAARLRITLVAWIIVLPSTILWPLVPTVGTSLLFLALAIGGAALAQSSAPAIIQDIVPNRMRGQAIVLYLLFASILGIGFGPTAVALATDEIFGSDADLPYSLVGIGVPFGILGLWLCWSGLRPYASTLLSIDKGNA